MRVRLAAVALEAVAVQPSRIAHDATRPGATHRDSVTATRTAPPTGSAVRGIDVEVCARHPDAGLGAPGLSRSAEALERRWPRSPGIYTALLPRSALNTASSAMPIQWLAEIDLAPIAVGFLEVTIAIRPRMLARITFQTIALPTDTSVDGIWRRGWEADWLSRARDPARSAIGIVVLQVLAATLRIDGRMETFVRAGSCPADLRRGTRVVARPTVRTGEEGRLAAVLQHAVAVCVWPTDSATEHRACAVDASKARVEERADPPHGAIDAASATILVIGERIDITQ